MRGLGITPSTVYVGGNFTSANGVARTRLAAFTTSTGAMTGWAPAAAGGYVWAMTMTPDKTRVIPAGSFTTLSGQPAYGMGSLMASAGSRQPVAGQDRIRDGRRRRRHHVDQGRRDAGLRHRLQLHAERNGRLGGHLRDRPHVGPDQLGQRLPG